MRPDEHKLVLKLKQKKAKFNYKILNKLFKRESIEITLEYQEATISESIDFLEFVNKSDFSIIEFVFDFINTFGDKKITKRDFYENVIVEFGEFLKIIKQTRFNGFFQYENEKIDPGQGEIIDKDVAIEKLRKSIGKAVAFFCSISGLNPKEVMKTYTWRELIYWMNHYIYFENEKTEAGKQQNRIKDTQDHIQENKDFYDNQIKELDLFLKKEKTGKKS